MNRERIDDLFLKACKGLVKQGKAAYNERTGSCEYKTEDGKKCALGQILPKGFYHDDLEGQTAPYFPNKHYFNDDIAKYFGFENVKEYQKHHTDDNKGVWSKLQTCHDESVPFEGVADTQFIPTFTKKALYVATSHKLTKSKEYLKKIVAKYKDKD